MASNDRLRATTGDRPGIDPTDAAPPRPAAVSLDQPFDVEGLYGLRSAVSAHGSHLGLSDRRLEDLVLIANELATNAIRHGGGGGRLVLWGDDGAVHCQVSDAGPGLTDPANAGTRPVPVGAVDGRGLWIARRLSDGFHVASGPEGATLTATVILGNDQSARIDGE
jgi:anti-sigma regulatory factor (Ser/Thr protein kinase)